LDCGSSSLYELDEFVPHVVEICCPDLNKDELDCGSSSLYELDEFVPHVVEICCPEQRGILKLVNAC
jgi:hypothetical protein